MLKKIAILMAAVFCAGSFAMAAPAVKPAVKPTVKPAAMGTLEGKVISTKKVVRAKKMKKAPKTFMAPLHIKAPTKEAK